MTRQPEIVRPSASAVKCPAETFRLLFLDCAENIPLLLGVCKEVGYEVIGTTSIDQAWAFLNGKDHVDVIVCAAHLEEESMFRFLDEVRSNEVHSKVMFLILSLEPGVIGAKLDVSTARVGNSLGANAYLVMPVFDAVALVAKIRELQPRIPALQLSATTAEKERSQ